MQNLLFAVTTVTSMAYSTPSLMQHRPLISLSLFTFAQASKLQSSPWKLAGELKKKIKKNQHASSKASTLPPTGYWC